MQLHTIRLPGFLYHDAREFTSQLGPVNLSLLELRGYRPPVPAAHDCHLLFGDFVRPRSSRWAR